MTSSAVSASFDATLRSVGTTLTHDDLLRLYRSPSAPPVDTRVTLAECKFFDMFASSPQDANKQFDAERKQAEKERGTGFVGKILKSRTHHPLKKQRRFDFRLDEHESARLEELGFVVSQRLSAESFAEIYYQLYTDDMPVYITSDSVLHAWHRSFDAFLVDLEEKQLAPRLQSILEKVLSSCRSLLSTTSESEATKRAMQDVYLFFSIANDLLLGERTQVDAGLVPTDWIKRLDAIHTAINAETMINLELFSSDARDVDFSLFKPRGHYTKSDTLKRYFGAMSWLGTVDFRVDGTENADNDLYQLQCACLVVHVFREAQVMSDIDALLSIISMITGDGPGADSMTPLQLHELLGDRDILETYIGEDKEAALRSLQDEIANRGLGAQAIVGHPIVESASAAGSLVPTRPPTSFAVIGQQFVWSAFVFSKIVFDQVVHNDTKVVRRMPSAVDVAFALFGNDVAADVIAKRMQTTSGEDDPSFVRFRDGVPYTSNLVAVRQVIDEALESVDPTMCSLAMLWQLALRELSSASASGATLLQSDAWKMRQMNTQVASFAQLRHDTILYAKQSCTFQTCCEYAAGYVDPYPKFWERMQQLGQRGGEIVKKLKAMPIVLDKEENPFAFDRFSVADRFFDNFSSVTRQLKDIAIAQAQKQPLSAEQDDFLKRVMEERHGSGGSRYLGWYPSLFYTQRKDSGKQDHIVADVHTDVPSAEHGDAGGILHLGVGNVNMGFFAVDKTMYAGPVFSVYEFVTSINERLTDEEFSKRLDAFQPPEWAARSFLATSTPPPPKRLNFW